MDNPNTLKTVILNSFEKAALIGALISKDDDETSSSGATGGGYTSPGHDNGVLAPYNFSFN